MSGAPFPLHDVGDLTAVRALHPDARVKTEQRHDNLLAAIRNGWAQQIPPSGRHRREEPIRNCRDRAYARPRQQSRTNPSLTVWVSGSRVECLARPLDRSTTSPAQLGTYVNRVGSSSRPEPWTQTGCGATQPLLRAAARGSARETSALRYGRPSPPASLHAAVPGHEESTGARSSGAVLGGRRGQSASNRAVPCLR